MVIWCEEMHNIDHPTRFQPANVATAFFAIVYGIAMLVQNRPIPLSFHSVTAVLLIYAGVGSVAFHAAPIYSQHTHPADLIPVYALFVTIIVHVTKVLLTQITMLKVSFFWLFAIQSAGIYVMLIYFANDAGTLRKSELPLALAMLGLHGFVGFCQFLITNTQLKCFSFYVCVIALLGGAYYSQQVEADGCPSWLFEQGISLHAFWHFGIFTVVYLQANILQWYEFKFELPPIQYILLAVKPHVVFTAPRYEIRRNPPAVAMNSIVTI
tara:strand:+ start:2762 stop:3565 length:804 start_codon:yes stop_codon:yes gene_type:complete